MSVIKMQLVEMLEIVSIDIALSEAAIISISEISDENIEMICIA